MNQVDLEDEKKAALMLAHLSVPTYIMKHILYLEKNYRNLECMLLLL